MLQAGGLTRLRLRTFSRQAIVSLDTEEIVMALAEEITALLSDEGYRVNESVRIRCKNFLPS
jgi:uncharacterized membrane protein